MSNINLDALIEKRAEATGSEKGRIPFDFKGDTYTFQDPLTLTDEDKEELAGLEWEPDIAAWYMGDDQYEKFVTSGGSSTLWFLVFREYLDRNEALDPEGKATRLNRSQRRMAGRKQSKRR